MRKKKYKKRGSKKKLSYTISNTSEVYSCRLPKTEYFKVLLANRLQKYGNVSAYIRSAVERDLGYA